MLDRAVSMVINPGSNLKGQVAGANWVFLLPDMNLDRILCLGVPSVRTRVTLNHLSPEVLIVTEEPHLTVFQSQFQNHRIIFTPWEPKANSIPVSLPNGAVDLIVINGSRMIRKLYSTPSLQTDLLGLLNTQGFIYLELSRVIERLSTTKMAEQLAINLGKVHYFWSSPLLGEVQTAVPAEDTFTIDYFLRNRLYHSESKTHMLTLASRFILGPLIQKKSLRRQSILISHENTFDMHTPPEYLDTLASQAGVNIQGYRWGLVAHGEYSTRKVLFYLFKPDDKSPEYIVKLVRDPAYNSRLENEYHALSTLWDKGVGALNILPKPVFFGYHQGLAILGENAIAGKPFRKMMGNHPDCSYAQRVVQHLKELGIATIDPYSTTPGEAARMLKRLFDSFVRVYQPSRDVQTFLEKQILVIASCKGIFPLVFQHGDPGAWNILASLNGEVFFLDWESAEPKGIPLWDMFYFLRSFAIALARKSGIRDALKGFEQQFLLNGQFRRFTFEALQDYCHKLELPAELVEPLFYTCWMHRSLKEANRLKPDQLYKSRYFNLLVYCIQKRSKPQMSRLFGAGY
jgi:hypothetical protein